jgi:hypothetical protein
MTGRTYEKVKAIAAAVEADPAMYGDLAEAMDRTGKVVGHARGQGGQYVEAVAGDEGTESLPRTRFRAGIDSYGLDPALLVHAHLDLGTVPALPPVVVAAVQRVGDLTRCTEEPLNVVVGHPHLNLAPGVGGGPQVLFKGQAEIGDHGQGHDQPPEVALQESGHYGILTARRLRRRQFSTGAVEPGGTQGQSTVPTPLYLSAAANRQKKPLILLVDAGPDLERERAAWRAACDGEDIVILSDGPADPS